VHTSLEQRARRCGVCVALLQLCRRRRHLLSSSVDVTLQRRGGGGGVFLHARVLQPRLSEL
jgi:hypothetical protein